MYEVSYVDGPLRGRTSQVPVVSQTIEARVGLTTVVYVLQEGPNRLAQYSVSAALTAMAVGSQPKIAKRSRSTNVTVLKAQRAKPARASMKARRSRTPTTRHGDGMQDVPPSPGSRRNSRD